MSRKYIIVEYSDLESNNSDLFEIHDSDSIIGLRNPGVKVIFKEYPNNLAKHNAIFRAEFSSMRLANAELNRLKVLLKLYSNIIFDNFI